MWKPHLLLVGQNLKEQQVHLSKNGFEITLVNTLIEAQHIVAKSIDLFDLIILNTDIATDNMLNDFLHHVCQIMVMLITNTQHPSILTKNHLIRVMDKSLTADLLSFAIINVLHRNYMLTLAR